MIVSLHIENVAVIKTLNVDFSSGFTVLTGETGAGKSILIDSLALLLGVRADRELIRAGESYAEVSALFDGVSDRTEEILRSMELSSDDGSLLLTRRIGMKGSVCRIGSKPVTITMLREVASTLFHIHGQNDTGILLDPASYLSQVDSFAGNGELIASYGEVYRKVLDCRRKEKLFSESLLQKERNLEIWKYQLGEIDSLKPKIGEVEKLTEESQRLQNLEKLTKCSGLIDKAMHGNEKGGALYYIDRCASALDTLTDAIPRASELSDSFRRLYYELQNVTDEALSALHVECDDPTAVIDRMEGRLALYEKICRKYGPDIKDVLALRAELEEKIKMAEHSEEMAGDLADERRAAEKEAFGIADKLHERRLKAAMTIQKQVTEVLRFLDMPNVRFEIAVTRSNELNSRGADEGDFLVATNPGEEPSPLRKIASGGELSRIMLALKTVLLGNDGIGTMIFDEIDTGISGKTSRKVGIKMKEIAGASQVLCVTHSAQIASLADEHLKIFKSEKDGRSETGVVTLSYDQRVEEIARILGGISVTDKQRDAAKELLLADFS